MMNCLHKRCLLKNFQLPFGKVVTLLAIGHLDLMVLRVFSNPNNSIILVHDLSSFSHFKVVPLKSFTVNILPANH